MRFLYTIYPEAQKKLENSGIAKRVKDLEESENSIPFLGYVSESDVKSFLENDLAEKGFLNTLPSDIKNPFLTKMQDFFKEPEKLPWKLHRYNGIAEEEAELEDLLLSSGWFASHVLIPEEIWDYEKLGFSSITDFTGSVGAYMQNRKHSSLRKGFRWETKHPDNRIIFSEVTGDHDSDLNICQLDITPYKTIDPFGNEVSYRPEFHAERMVVDAYHSVEASLFSSIMKWIEQENIPSEVLKDNAESIIESAISSGQRVGYATEHLGGFDQHPMQYLTQLSSPIPVLNPDFCTEEETLHGIVSDSGGWYRLYISQNKELVFSYKRHDEETKQKKEVSAIFQPEDADNLIRGLLFQSSNALGRTSARQLVSILQYRFSEEYKEHLKEFS